MVFNQGPFRILSIIAFETVKSKREENQKSMISFFKFWGFRYRL